MSQYRLNPCPFCGRSINLGRTIGGWSRAMCWEGAGDKSHPHVLTLDANSSETTIALWNSKPQFLLLRLFVYSNRLQQWWIRLNGYNNFTFPKRNPKVKRKSISIRWFSYDHSRTSWKVFFTKYTEKYHRQNEKVYQLNIWTRKHMTGINLAISY